MDSKFLTYFLLFFHIRNCQIFAAAENEFSEEFILCNSLFESQLKSLKTDNEFLKLRFEMLQMQLDKQGEILKDLPQSLENMQSKLLFQSRDQFLDLTDFINKQTQVKLEPLADDKWQMISDIKEIVTEHEVVLKSYSEKLKNVEDILGKASWETHTQKLGDTISKKLSLLENIDKNLKNVENITVTKTDQIAFDIQKYFNKNETTRICLKDEDEKLVGTNQTYPTDCSDFNEEFCANNKCRIYNHLYATNPFLVSCDDLTEGGGWTVIQRRLNGTVDFFRGWSDYKTGFGDIDGEFFIGLDKLHALTTTLQPVELLIQLQDFNDVLQYARYDELVVGNETEKYKLHKVGKYSGNAGDSFSNHQGKQFSTKDNDNDEDSNDNCANYRKGAWWYGNCFWSNLNGQYYKNGKSPSHGMGIIWGTFHGYQYSMKFVQMMIRPKKIQM